MFRNTNPKIIFLLTALFPLLMAVAVRGEPDDDDSNLLVEAIADVVFGYLAGVCMKNGTCGPILAWVCLVSVVLTLIMWISDGCPMPNITGHHVRRAVTSYVGMRLAD